MGKKATPVKASVQPKGNPGLFHVMLVNQTSPKFAHNAKSAGKEPVWTYDYWEVDKPTNTGGVAIKMDVDKFKKMNENQQSVAMNNFALNWVKNNVKGCTSTKLVSRR